MSSNSLFMKSLFIYYISSIYRFIVVTLKEVKPLDYRGRQRNQQNKKSLL